MMSNRTIIIPFYNKDNGSKSFDKRCFYCTSKIKEVKGCRILLMLLKHEMIIDVFASWRIPGEQTHMNKAFFVAHLRLLWLYHYLGLITALSHLQVQRNVGKSQSFWCRHAIISFGYAISTNPMKLSKVSLNVLYDGNIG